MSVSVAKDFFDGIERVLHSGAASPAEIPNQPMTGKSALKRVIKEHDAKDLRKACVSRSGCRRP